MVQTCHTGKEEGVYITPDSPPANTRVETGDGYVALILPDIRDNSDVDTERRTTGCPVTESMKLAM